MDFHQLLHRLQAEEYWFRGVCYYADVPNDARPLLLSFEPQAEGSRLKLRGSYRRDEASAPHAFEFSIQVLDVREAPYGYLNSVHTGELMGRLFALRTGFTVLLTGEAPRAISLNFDIARTGEVHASGLVTCDAIDFSFVANGVPGRGAEQLSNVVGILGGKRA